MRKNFLRVMALGITLGMLLEEPAMAYAADASQIAAGTETTDGTQDGSGTSEEENNGENKNETPDNDGEDKNETPDGDGEDKNETPDGDGADKNETPGNDGEDKNETPDGDGADKNETPDGDGADKNETPDGDGADKNETPDGDGADKNETPDGDGADKNEIPGGEGEDKNETPGSDGEDKNEIPGNEGAAEGENKVPPKGEELDKTDKAEVTEKKELLEGDKLLEREEPEEEEVTAQNGVWNIIDFGAASGTDSTYAINKALGSISGNDTTVLIPKGTYNLVGWLKVPSNARIVFEDGAALNGDGKCGGFLIQGGSNVKIENPVIRNVSIGIKAQSGASDIHVTGGNIQPTASGVGVSIENASGIEVRDVAITNSQFGVLAEGGSNIQVLNSEITNQSMGCIWIQKGSSGVTITSNTLRKGREAAVWIDGSSGVTVNSNTMEENGNAAKQSTYGVKINNSSSVRVQGNTIANNIKQGINVDTGSTGVTIASNTIQRNGAIGVCVGNGSSLEVSDNKILQNQDHGIILMNSYGTIKNNKIDGANSVGTVTRSEHYGIIILCRNVADKNKVIEISNNEVSGMTGNGIQITGDKNNPGSEGAVNVLISGNRVSNVGDNGITVNYNSHNAVITANTVTGAGVNGIDIQGGSKNCKVDHNTVNNSGYMGISIGSANSGAGAEVVGNKVDASKNVGIHITNSATSATVSNNTVTNHSGNFSIAAVNGAKASLAQNTVTLPMNYITQFTNVVQYAIFVSDGMTTTNGAVKFNFRPDIPAAGATAFTGSGTPGLTVVLNLNGSEKSAKIDSKWKYSIACNALKATDSYQISAKDGYGNAITYTNGTITNSVDETKVRAFVERMYTVALGRPADTAGCNYWVNQLVTGAKDGAIVAKGFVLSPEMEKRKLNNEQFVVMLYRTFFDREPAANDSGKAFWINLLENGVTRAYVFRGFCHSQEFTNICTRYGIVRGNITLTENRDQNHDITMYVFRCYDRTLGRQPDAKGLNFWTGQILEKKRTPSDVAGNFVFSEEFKKMKLSDEEYVKVMYRMFFDREYDENGLKFWLNELKTGKRDRYKVFTGFANSKEFKAVLQKFGL